MSKNKYIVTVFFWTAKTNVLFSSFESPGLSPGRAAGRGIELQWIRYSLDNTPLNIIGSAWLPLLDSHTTTGCTVTFFLSAVLFGRLRWTVLQLVFASKYWFYITEICSSTTGILSVDEGVLNKPRETGLSKKVSCSPCLAWWNHGSVEMHLYCLMNVSWVLDERTTAWIIKLLWGWQGSGEGHQESLRNYGLTALNCSKSVPLHTFSLWTLFAVHV